MSLRSAVLRQGAMMQRRFATVSAPKKPFVPKQYQRSFRENFVSDPSTYPLIVILGTALTFMVGMSVNAFATYKDLRISPKVKHETIQNWGTEKSKSIPSSILPFLPKAMHGDDFASLRNEGLGIDHEEWKKSKGQ